MEYIYHNYSPPFAFISTISYTFNGGCSLLQFLYQRRRKFHRQGMEVGESRVEVGNQKGVAKTTYTGRP